ncbi:hypothetical protein U136B_020 [Escherichia phage U136B]|jgi:hypothetical protein|uniref:Uncharacterized protein n=1 Tax=Escherichia phage U136B TaxID=2812882 RepID=A0A894JTP1_9CAUD|nr:hypothetical protein U136B_020 [Escherichia phage U136B]WPK28051.1 hypothetical protein [Escherichia phage vB-Eco-KMB25]
MIKFIGFVALLVCGIWLTDNDTWQSAVGGLLIFLAGGMVGSDDATNKNKLSDHLRRETKR